MGLLQIMGSKVGHLLSHSSEASTPGSHLRWHSNRTDQSQSYKEDNVGLEREQQQNQYRRAVSENDSREEFRGPDTTSLSAFLCSFFSSSEAGGRSADDQILRQRLVDEGRSENVASFNSESRFSSGRLQVAVSASNENLQKETLDDIVRKKGITSGFEDEDLEEADWHLVSKHDVGNVVRTDSQAQRQKPSNVCILKLPSMSETSSLLSEALRQSLLSALPTLACGRQWTLIYSTQRHGISLLTLYRRSSILPGPCLLVTGDTEGAVFGGLLSAPLFPTPKKKYQGTSETFVFTDVSGKPELYHPTGSNRYFVLCTNDALALGGGGHFALHLDNDLLTGSSGSCATFGNTCLAHSEDFIVKNVELWGFAHSSRYVPLAASFEEPTEAPGVCRW